MRAVVGDASFDKNRFALALKDDGSSLTLRDYIGHNAFDVAKQLILNGDVGALSEVRDRIISGAVWRQKVGLWNLRSEMIGWMWKQYEALNGKRKDHLFLVGKCKDGAVSALRLTANEPAQQGVNFSIAVERSDGVLKFKKAKGGNALKVVEILCAAGGCELGGEMDESFVSLASAANALGGSVPVRELSPEKVLLLWSEYKRLASMLKKEISDDLYLIGRVLPNGQIYGFRLVDQVDDLMEKANMFKVRIKRMGDDLHLTWADGSHYLSVIENLCSHEGCFLGGELKERHVSLHIAALSGRTPETRTKGFKSMSEIAGYPDRSFREAFSKPMTRELSSFTRAELDDLWTRREEVDGKNYGELFLIGRPLGEPKLYDIVRDASEFDRKEHFKVLIRREGGDLFIVDAQGYGAMQAVYVLVKNSIARLGDDFKRNNLHHLAAMSLDQKITRLDDLDYDAINSLWNRHEELDGREHESLYLVGRLSGERLIGARLIGDRSLAPASKTFSILLKRKDGRVLLGETSGSGAKRVVSFLSSKNGFELSKGHRRSHATMMTYRGRDRGITMKEFGGGVVKKLWSEYERAKGEDVDELHLVGSFQRNRITGLRMIEGDPDVKESVFVIRIKKVEDGLEIVSASGKKGIAMMAELLKEADINPTPEKRDEYISLASSNLVGRKGRRVEDIDTSLIAKLWREYERLDGKSHSRLSLVGIHNKNKEKVFKLRVVADASDIKKHYFVITLEKHGEGFRIISQRGTFSRQMMKAMASKGFGSGD
jgi:hypothetical protein